MIWEEKDLGDKLKEDRHIKGQIVCFMQLTKLVK
jgi:hypothetical protein